MFLGIDPGRRGGIVALHEDGRVARAIPTPESERDVLNTLHWCTHFNDGYTDRQEAAHAVLERVWSSPGWGHAGSFRFGVSVGELRMALTAEEIPFDEVLPRAWQKAMGITFKKWTPPIERKRITRRRAQQLFPGITVTHAIADALLLAEFCRRTKEGLHGKAEESKETTLQSRPADGRRTAAHRGESREEFVGQTGEDLARRRSAASPEVAPVARHGGPARHATRSARQRRG